MEFGSEGPRETNVKSKNLESMSSNPSHTRLCITPGIQPYSGILNPSSLHTHGLQHGADQEGWTQQELFVYIPCLPVGQKPEKEISIWPQRDLKTSPQEVLKFRPKSAIQLHPYLPYI